MESVNSLTNEQILSMEPGRELDELVGTEVMGWTSKYNNISGYSWFHERGVPVHTWKPSTDISTAWEIIEKMLSKKFSYRLGKYNRNHHCEFIGWTPYVERSRKQIVAQVECATITSAICKAALIATMKLNRAGEIDGTSK